VPQPAVGRRILKFPDDTQVGVVGLDAIMADLLAQGLEPGEQVAEQIMERLEKEKNYIPTAERARREYAYALLKEYRRYVKDRKG